MKQNLVNMLTTTLIRQHNKCLSILQLIQECNNRISVAHSDLHMYDHGHWSSPIRLFNTRTALENRLNHYHEVRKRIQKSYEENMCELIRAHNREHLYHSFIHSSLIKTDIYE